MHSLTANTPADTVAYLWRGLGLPAEALDALDLPPGDAFPSSFKVAHLAQATVATAALAGALLHATRIASGPPDPGAAPTLPRVRVDAGHAAAAFVSERLLRINGAPAQPEWGVLGGLYATRDGHVRVHDSFEHHRAALLRLLGLPAGEERREAVAGAIATWDKLALEDAALAAGAVAYALRSEPEWAATAQARAEAESSCPIALHPTPPQPRWPPLPLPTAPPNAHSRPLAGLRVLDLSRVVAAPVAGRTLAALGADVLWVTSPRLPSLPGVDADVSRGKRSAYLHLDEPADAQRLRELVQGADIFIQSYRPGALEARGLGRDDVRKLAPGIVYASLSAWTARGPWGARRGFDSLVQTASGLNDSEAQAAGGGDAARPLPCQALDHGAGYLLAAGVLAAVYHRMMARRAGGGEADSHGWDVDVSLAGVMGLLKSLGRQEMDADAPVPSCEGDAEWTETTHGALGEVRGVRFPATIGGVDTSLGPPSVRGADTAEWV